jgi:hypothetical protein
LRGNIYRPITENRQQHSHGDTFRTVRELLNLQSSTAKLGASMRGNQVARLLTAIVSRS